MVAMQIIWASYDEKMTNDAFLQERRDAVNAFVASGKILPPIYNPSDNTATISFSSMESAQEYEALLKGLAEKYNKGVPVFSVVQSI